jgi:hypothetical protein
MFIEDKRIPTTIINIMDKFFQYLTYVITFRIAFTVYESNKVVFFAISKRRWFCKLLPVFNFCIQSFLSEAFISSSWCSFEAEYTLSLKLDMKESKTIIPLYTDNYSLINKPTFLEGGSVSCFQCLISVFSPSISSGYHISGSSTVQSITEKGYSQA